MSRKGVGEKLIRSVKTFAQIERAAFVQLETAADNYPAQRLYETISFVKQEPDQQFLVYRIAIS